MRCPVFWDLCRRLEVWGDRTTIVGEIEPVRAAPGDGSFRVTKSFITLRRRGHRRPHCSHSSPCEDHRPMAKDKTKPKSRYAALLNEVCVRMGYCGSMKDGERLHVDDFIPDAGLVTADQFAEWVVL